MAHNGPTGLGAAAHSPCGVDWLPEPADHGDEDLEAALRQLAAHERAPSLVLYGHMHSSLARRQGLRDRLGVSHGAICLNVAVVPRIRGVHDSEADAPLAEHHFTVVRLDAASGRLEGAEDVWVTVAGGAEPSVVSARREPLVRRKEAASLDDPASHRALEWFSHYKGDWRPLD